MCILNIVVLLNCVANRYMNLVKTEVKLNSVPSHSSNFAHQIHTSPKRKEK